MNPRSTLIERKEGNEIDRANSILSHLLWWGGRGGWLTLVGREVGQKKEARSKGRRPLGSRPCLSSGSNKQKLLSRNIISTWKSRLSFFGEILKLKYLTISEGAVPRVTEEEHFPQKGNLPFQDGDSLAFHESATVFSPFALSAKF